MTDCFSEKLLSLQVWGFLFTTNLQIWLSCNTVVQDTANSEGAGYSTLASLPPCKAHLKWGQGFQLAMLVLISKANLWLSQQSLTYRISCFTVVCLLSLSYTVVLGKSNFHLIFHFFFLRSHCLYALRFTDFCSCFLKRNTTIRAIVDLNSFVNLLAFILLLKKKKTLKE